MGTLCVLMPDCWKLREREQVQDDGCNHPSPRCGDKRPHSSIGSGGGSADPCKPIKVHATTGAKPKAGDYEIAVQKILGEAIPMYHGYLSTVTPYPAAMEEMRWAKKSWRGGCKSCETHMTSNDEIVKLITSRSAHFRGRIKTKVQPLVKSMYGFSSISKPRAIGNNIKLARELKNKITFVYAKRKDGGNRGVYQHPIIQQTIIDVWFNNKRDDGPRFPNIYKPFPKVALALVLTAIENCIDEWADGMHTNISFTQDAYQDVFNDHLEELNRFDDFTKSVNLLPSLLLELHDEGRLHSKADSFEKSNQRAQSPSAYAAAMEEFRNGGYQGSEASEEV